jgi:hypothetical protein
MRSRDMKVNELRIGNWVLISCYAGDEYKYFKNAMVKVSAIQSNTHITATEHQIVYPIDGIRGIPITEETLDLLQFYNTERVTNNNSFKCYETTFYDRFDNERFGFELSRNNERLGEIKYVHQLQNLYFALTCEELTIGV